MKRVEVVMGGTSGNATTNPLAGFGVIAIIVGALSMIGSWLWGLMVIAAGCGLILGRKWGGMLALVVLAGALLQAMFVPGIWLFNSFKIFVTLILAIILAVNWRLLR